VTTVVYLVRHGEQDLAAGAPDSGLSAAGREQAHRLAARVAGFGLHEIAHSPAARAAETAAILGEALPGLPVVENALLADRTPVPAPGSEHEYPATATAFLNSVPEDERDVGGQGCQSAVEHWATLDTAPGQERRCLLVTHAFVIGWFVRHALDAPTWRWLGLNSVNTGITTIRFGPGGRALAGFNDAGHLMT
jgi:broad specificity phosphatase PhoE